MKKINKINSLLVILATTLCIFGSLSIKTAYADADKLSAGKEISITGVNGNLNNVNIKIEFTTSVNLDGTNNALLVGLAASDDTLLTDARFVAAATNVGVYDGDSVAINFENAPEVIGTKTNVESNYTYTIETRDFTVVNATKDIAKLVVVGQKGTEITSEFNFSEVKYSVKFADEDAIEYSYNAIIADPINEYNYVFDFDGHQAVTGFTGDDSSSFVSGTTRATKDIVYSLATGAKQAHNWSDVPEVEATTTTSGTLAHQICSCGAIRLSASATELVSAEELKIAPIGHVCDYVASFNWEGVEAGNKPAVTYTCSNPECGNHYEMPAADITLVEKEGSRINATCENPGSVTYVASCTYEGVVASDEKIYELAQLDHTLTHVAAKAPTVEEDGNKEYWTCSECGNYYLDEECSNQTTLAAVTLSKYTLEKPQYISVVDLKAGGKVSNSIQNTGQNYDYSLEGAPANKSVVFFATLDFKEAQNGQIYIYGDPGANWNFGAYIWIYDNRLYYGATDDNGVFDHNVQVNYDGFTLETGKKYSIEYGRQAIMNGNTFTGKYRVYFNIDGENIFYVDQALENVIASGGRMHFTGDGGNNYLDAYEYEEAKEISVSDLLRNGQSVGDQMFLTSYNDLTFDNSDHAENYSLVFKFKYYTSDPDEREFHLLSNELSNYNDAKWWGIGSFILKPTSAHLGKGSRVADGNHAWFDSNTYRMKSDEEFDVEYGRLALMHNGEFAGKYFAYLKVDGELILSDNMFLPEEYITGNAVFMTGNSNTGVTTRIIDANYTEPNYEVADIISVNDLYYNGTYLNGQMDLLDNRVYSYTSTTEYGSVIFKGVFNFNAENYVDNTDYGTQVRFNDGSWDPEAMIWFAASSGILIADKDYNYQIGKKLPTDKDVNVEFGRLAILDDENEFTGKHYFYVKVDGALVVQFTSSLISEADYTSERIFFTGKPGNGPDVIKNVAIANTVTIKVGDHEEDVEVLRSGLIELPNLDAYVPDGKRLVGWKVEGTNNEFNPLADRVFADLVIVATIDDFKWKITFGTEELFFDNNEDITVPTNIPTKPYDDENHYEFDCWVDANNNPFVAGTKATADAVYTAKFTPVAHVYGEWNVTLEPGCDTVGSRTRTCECGHSETEEIPATHKLTKVDAVAATCTANGNIEYYLCSECNKMFADEDGTTEITDVVTLAHGLVHHDAVEASCNKNGNIEYWECLTCHKYYSDAAGTNEVDTIVTPKQHDLVKVEAVAATCEDDGNIEYYHCRECGKNVDENGTQLTNVVVKATGHKYGEDGKCSVCGEKDPNYVEPEQPVKKGCKGAAASGLISLIALAGLLFKRKNNYNK